MPIATVTSKGQVTIPKRVRELLQVDSGDKLEFRIEGDGTVRLVPITRSAASAFGAFAHKAKRSVSRQQAKQAVAAALRGKKDAKR